MTKKINQKMERGIGREGKARGRRGRRQTKGGDGEG